MSEEGLACVKTQTRSVAAEETFVQIADSCANISQRVRLTAICIVDGTGKIEREGVVASDPETITAFIKSHAPNVTRIGLRRGRRQRGYGLS